MIPGVDGFMYPNEVELQWSVLIVLYPFITGLVAGAFILASLERVFKVEAVRPTYRLALLTALAFLLVAPLPLQLHLGHPERSFEMYTTPHRSSAMAMFGFVYLWYLTVVLLLEIWLDYRADIVRLAQSSKGFLRLVYRALTLGSMNVSPEARKIDDKVGYAITVIGIDTTTVAAASNTLIPRARAKISMRVAPGGDAEAHLDALTAHLRQHTPWGAHVSVTRGEKGEPYAIDATGAVYDAARAAFRQAWDTDPIDMGMGGSIPFIAEFAAAFPQAKILVTGVEDPGTQAHSINESLHLGVLERAAVAEALLLANLA